MPYAEGRTFHDADSHVMELPEWLPSYAEPGYRDRIPPFSLLSTGSRSRVEQMMARGKLRAGNLAGRADHEAELMTRKSWEAYGAFHPGRPSAGARPSRVPLPAGVLPHVRPHPVRGGARRGPELRHSLRALTRGIVEFCSSRSASLARHFRPADGAGARDCRSSLRARRGREGGDDIAVASNHSTRSPIRTPSPVLRAARGARRAAPLSRRRACSPKSGERLHEQRLGGPRRTSTAEAKTSPGWSTWP